MNRNDIYEMRSMLMEDLIVFDKFCEEHEIKYFLSSGTLLGAVRHDGFIPWDDDLDIMLTRDNYNKLLADRHLLNTDHLELVNYETDECMTTIYAHLIDYRAKLFKKKSDSKNDYLHIDIYACDYIKETWFTKSALALAIESFLNRLYSYRKGYISVDDNHAWLKKSVLRFGSIIFRNISDEKLIQIILGLVRAKSDEGSMAPVASPYGYRREQFPSKYYKELIKHKFENAEFPISRYYSEILTQLYGDYMKLPPESTRFSELNEYHFIKTE